MKILISISLIIITVLMLCLTGCIAELALLEEGAALEIAEEGAALGAAEEGIAAFEMEDALMSSSERSLLALEEREIIGGTVTSETALTELENVRLVEQPNGRPPQLRFVNKSGEPFAEVINKRKLRFFDGKGEVYLNNDIYAIKGDNIPLRTSPTTNISNIKRMLTNENGKLVLKLGEQNGWYKVLIDRNEIGWIKNSLLIPVIIAGSERRNYYPKLDKKTSFGYVMKVCNYDYSDKIFLYYYLNMFDENLSNYQQNEFELRRKEDKARLEIKTLIDTLKFERIYSRDQIAVFGNYDFSNETFEFQPFNISQCCGYPSFYVFNFDDRGLIQKYQVSNLSGIYMKNFKDFSGLKMNQNDAENLLNKRIPANNRCVYLRFYYSVLNEKYKNPFEEEKSDHGLFCFVYLVEVWGDKFMRSNRIAVLYAKNNPPEYLEDTKNNFYKKYNAQNNPTHK